MSLSVLPNAPRFHTLWQHIENDRRIFAIRREDWNSLNTDDDPNLWHYANDHIFLVKEEPGDDHWLRELPNEVYALFSSR